MGKHLGTPAASRLSGLKKMDLLLRDRCPANYQPVEGELAPPTRLGKKLRGWGLSPCCRASVRVVRAEPMNGVACAVCMVVVG